MNKNKPNTCMDKTYKIQMTIEVELTVYPGTTLEDVIEQFQPDGGWGNGDIWTDNFSVLEWKEIK